MTQQNQTLPDPRCFEALRRILGALADLAAHGEPERYERQMSGWAIAERAGLVGPVPMSVVVRTCREAADAGDREARLNVWFDAFRTMKTLRALRDDAPDLPWRDAIERAPFGPSAVDAPGDVLRALSEAERRTPAVIGPTLARAPFRRGAKGR